MGPNSGDDYVKLMVNRDYESIIRPRIAQKNLLLAGHKAVVEFRHLSIALLRAGRVSEAIDHFERLIDATRPDMRNDFDFCELGAALWLAGSVGCALDSWNKALRCNYGDGAMNMTPAIILYFASVRLSDNKLMEAAIAAIERKLDSGWAKNWPAPLGRFLIDLADKPIVEAELLREHPLRQPDESCRLAFYEGVKSIECGDKAIAGSCFRSAVNKCGQRTWTTEFVLARHELENLSA